MADLEKRLRMAAYDLMAALNDTGAGEVISEQGHADLRTGLILQLETDTDWDDHGRFCLGYECVECLAPVWLTTEGGIRGLALDRPCNRETRKLVKRYEKAEFRRSGRRL